jgi:hypothetical protein
MNDLNMNSANESVKSAGRPPASLNQNRPAGAPGGFSARIHDPAFSKYQKDSKNWSFLFSFILAAISIIAFPIYGNASHEISWPDSLFYGMGIGAMFISIAALQTWKRNLDQTWDGVVIDKQIYHKSERLQNGNTASYHEYVLKIKKDSGGIKKEKWVDAPALFNYFSVGDRLRHHHGFAYYEKYDKSIDLQILCIACNTFNEIELDACCRCKCPLLK